MVSPLCVGWLVYLFLEFDRLCSWNDRLWIGNPQRKILILILKRTKTIIKQKEKAPLV